MNDDRIKNRQVKKSDDGRQQQQQPHRHDGARQLDLRTYRSTVQ